MFGLPVWKERRWRLYIREVGLMPTPEEISIMRKLGRSYNPDIPIYLARPKSATGNILGGLVLFSFCQIFRNSFF